MSNDYPNQPPYTQSIPSQRPPPGTAAGSSFKTRYFRDEGTPPPARNHQQAGSSSKQNWRDYMQGLGSSMSQLDLVARRDKPLPSLPTPEFVQSPYRPSSLPPPLPSSYYSTTQQYYADPGPSLATSSTAVHQPVSVRMSTPTEPHPSYGNDETPVRTTHDPLRLPARSTHHSPRPASSSSLPSSPLISGLAPPKTFRPSFHPLTAPSPTNLRPPPIIHANSAPSPRGKGKSREDPIVLDHGPPSPCTPRRRVKSSVEADAINIHVRSPRREAAGATSSPCSSPSSAQRCAGTTRQGLPCKRVVKTSAPWLDLASVLGEADEEHPRMRGRYCKDHAGQICGVEGFYWGSTWVHFDDWIPRVLGQQTQALLRMAMESSLTPSECPGFIYAYELRDLATAELAFFKVGRTDNVPRRIGQWTTQCSSHTPTLRDIFPLANSQASNAVSVSLLPGATDGGTSGRTMSGAVKRLERLIHLELAERSPVTRLLDPCIDCGTVHKEIFPLSKAEFGQRTYEEVVKEVICRWERYIRIVCIDGE